MSPWLSSAMVRRLTALTLRYRSMPIASPAAPRPVSGAMGIALIRSTKSARVSARRALKVLRLAVTLDEDGRFLGRPRVHGDHNSDRPMKALMSESCDRPGTDRAAVSVGHHG